MTTNAVDFAINLQLQGMEKAQRAVQDFLRTIDPIAKGYAFAQFANAVGAAANAISGPLVSASNQYIQRYAVLETSARRYLELQNQQTQASDRMGRVATQALLPVMEKQIAFQNQLASFLERHPEIAQVVVGGGQMLVQGAQFVGQVGQGLAGIGQVASTFKGFLGELPKAAVAIGALAAGAKIGEHAVQEFGKATGDARLAAFTLDDALKTARQALVVTVYEFGKDILLARQAVERFNDILLGATAAWAVDMKKNADNVATGFRVAVLALQNAVAEFLNGVLELVASLASKLQMGDLAKSLREGKDWNAVRDSTVDGTPGKNNYERQMAHEVTELSKRWKEYSDETEQIGKNLVQNEKDREKAMEDGMKVLNALIVPIVKFAETGTLGDDLDKVFKGLGDFMGDAKKVVNDFFNSGTPKTAAAPTASPEALNAYIQYQRGLKESEYQFGIQKQEAARQFQKNEVYAERQYREQIELMHRDARLQEMEAGRRHNEQKFLAQRDFARNEIDIERRHQHDLEMLKRNHDRSMFELAREGDVAGAVNEMRRYAFAQEDDKRETEYQKNERQIQFDIQQAEQDKQYERELREMKYQNELREKEMAFSYEREKRERKFAYDEQLKEIGYAHEREKQERLRAFAQQLSDLQSNEAGLKKLRDEFYDQQIKDYGAFLSTNTTLMQNALKATYDMANNFKLPAAPKVGAPPPLSSLGGYNPSLPPPPNPSDPPPPGWTGSLREWQHQQQEALLEYWRNVYESAGGRGGQPSYPSYRDGIDYVPRDNYLARLHEGEKVLTRDENMRGGRSVAVNVNGDVHINNGDDLDAFGHKIAAIVEAVL